MFFWIVNALLLFILTAKSAAFINKIKKDSVLRKKGYEKVYQDLAEENEKLLANLQRSESELSEKYLFYDIARRIAPLTDHEHLRDMFGREIKHLEGVESLIFQAPLDKEEYTALKFGRASKDVFYVKAKSKTACEHFPGFAKLFELCSEKIKLYDRLQELSIYDSLTQTYNRRYFNLRYPEEFERSRRYGLALSFLMIDIDHFKKINDTYGHLVGDVALRSVAKLIRQSLREMDFVARFGGEEFSAILPETDKAAAIMVADRISARVGREKIRAFDEVINLTLSVGVAAYPQNTIYPDVLIETADKALYKAKMSGRNRVAWF